MREFRWQNEDGETLYGVLVTPPGAEGRPLPMVVQLHGGPQESDKFGYGPGVIVNYVPVLTALGYAVLRPNYRGSAGRGVAFAKAAASRQDPGWTLTKG